MQQITSHELLDEYRVQDGLILRVEKYQFHDKLDLDVKALKCKKRIKGLSSIYQLKEDVETQDGVVLKKGNYIQDFYRECRLTTQKEKSSQYKFELKCAGGTILGYGKELTNILNKVNVFVKERYGI